MRTLLRRLLRGRTRRSTVVECRRCGKTLSMGSEDCPECRSNAVIRYEIE